MSTKLHVYQNSFLTGVLDPRMGGRIDTDAYGQGLKVGNNISIHHLGSAKRRPGSRFVVELPNEIARYSSITETVPNGDSDTVPGNASDNDPDTTITAFEIGTNDPFVVVHYDLGTAQDVRFADVRRIILSDDTSDQFCIQYSTDDSAWATWGDNFELVDGVIERDYRRGNADGSVVTARYWRVVRDGSSDLTGVDVTLGEFDIWLESATLSNVRIFSFEISTSDQYVLVVTDECGTIVKDEDTLIGFIYLPYLSADIPDMDGANLAETLALVHEDYPPAFVIREVGTENFQFEEVPFDTVPQYDFDDTLSPTVTAEVQVITFASGWVQGNTFQVELDQAKSGPISYGGDSTSDEQNTTIENIRKAVQGLWSVNGFTGVVVTRTGTREYTVTFNGNSAGTYKLLVVNPLSTSNTATTTRSAVGVSRHEDAWSETRGYPRTVTFFEGRMYFGGSRSLQQSLFGSSINNILDFDPVEGLDDEPVFLTLTGTQLNAINGLFGGQSLQLFTTGGEFRFLKETGTPITPTDAPVPQTQYGSARIQPVSIDGATIFVHRTRKAVRDFEFEFERNAYSSIGVSSLAPHLINAVVDIAAWNGSEFDELNLVFVINGDGTLAAYNSRKETKTQAWVSWDTQGFYKAVGVVEQSIFFAVQRSIADVDHLFLEIVDDDCYTDCAVLQTQAASDVVFNLEHLNGEECRVRGDGLTLENKTPSAGSIITEINVEEIEVGLNFNPTLTPMPLSALDPSRSPTLLRKARIVEVRAKVRNTVGLLMNDRPIADRFFDINNFDEAGQLYTGNIRIEESTNWDFRDEKTITFSQEDPQPMEILMIEVTMQSEM